KYGILHNPRICPQQHEMNLSLSETHDRWTCGKTGCRMAVGIRKGTWLENSKLAFDKIITFTYSWAFKMTSIEFCERELLVGPDSAVDYNNFLREVCAASLLANPIIIGGEGLTVEIDESVFSKRKYNVGRLLPQQWVFGGICRETGECFIFAVPDRS